MYKKYHNSQKQKETKEEKNPIRSKPPPPLSPDKSKQKKNNSHTFIQHSQQQTKLFCMYKYKLAQMLDFLWRPLIGSSTYLLNNPRISAT